MSYAGPLIFKKILRRLKKESFLIVEKSFLKIFLYNVIVRRVFQKKLPQYHTQRPENSTYLFYYGHWKAGIDHCKSNLRFYLSEAGELNRICVLTDPNFHQKHNNGEKANESWTKYIEFEKSTFPKQIDYIFYNEFLKREFSKKEILVVQGNYEIKSEENRKYRVIIRNVGYYSLIKIAQGQSILFYPAKRIVDETKIVLNQISKSFCAVHIRRGDMLELANGLAIDLSPHNVIKKLRQYNPQKLPVFLMTNEPNRNYYDDLNNEFKVYRYYDFDNLIQVAEEKDNYLLYEIEKLIFLKAKIQIHTFPGIQNERSLSDNKQIQSKKWISRIPPSLLEEL